jgi:hypothetical protein
VNSDGCSASHGTDPELIGRYEQLRGERQKKVLSKEIAIFLGQGMYGWMRAWISCSVEPDAKSSHFAVNEPGYRRQSKNTTMLSSTIQAEAVHILAAMSLEKLKEVQL